MYMISRRFLRQEISFIQWRYLTYSHPFFSPKLEFQCFDTMVEKRRLEAKKSIIIETQNFVNKLSLSQFCSIFGDVKNIFQFKSPSQQVVYIIEFSSEDEANNIIQEAQKSQNHNSGIQPPNLFHLKFLSKKNFPEKFSSTTIKNNEIIIDSLLSQNEILKNIEQCSNMSEQMQYYYNQQKMTELGWRLRFLTCRKIESILPNLLSNARMLPFGSSVNSFGMYDCDLDVVLDLTTDFSNEGSKTKSFPLVSIPWSTDRNLSRKAIESSLHIIADSISLYLPAFSRIVRLMHAYVPIIKCTDKTSSLECDITVGDRSGYEMSRILYTYGCLDPRVRPLVFSLRWWSKSRGLTRKNTPGRWFSNFTTTLMVLFFLMNTRDHPVLPSWNKLCAFFNGSKNPKVGIPEDKSFESLNTKTLEDLMMEFFEFYSNFDFKKSAISITTGKSYLKPGYNPVHIQNPVELELNVARNLNTEEIQTWVNECQLALEYFNNCRVKSSLSSKIESNFSSGVESILNREVKSNLSEEIKSSLNSKSIKESKLDNSNYNKNNQSERDPKPSSNNSDPKLSSKNFENKNTTDYESSKANILNLIQFSRSNLGLNQNKPIQSWDKGTKFENDVIRTILNHTKKKRKRAS